MPNRYYTDNSDLKITAPNPPALQRGGKSGGKMNTKDSGFPGVPGKTQPKDRSNGVSKTGKLGPFNVKSEGI